LNELRHLPDTVMTLRRSLDETELTAGMALRGERGVHQGTDYRGVRVVAASRAVPDTAWVMVAKVDETELYAPLRQQALAVGAMTLTLLMAATFGVTVFSRRRDELFLRAQLTTEQERRVLAERYELAVVRDMTQREAHEAEINRLNRLYATLSQVNQTIARCQNREELFAGIARVIVDTGRFKTAWIGWKAAGTETLTRIAHRASGENPGLELPGWNRGCGMMTEALETGRACLCNGTQTDQRAACCHQVLAGLGVQSCGAFPLRLREEVRGALCLTSADPDFFNADEIRLLEEVASDVSFALDKLDEEEQRHQAEEARQRAEADLQLALEAGRLGDWSWNIVTGEISWSARCKALYGLPPETVVTYEGFLERLHPDDRGRIEAALRQAVESQTDYAVEKRVVWPDGSLHWNTSRGRVFRDDAGHPVRLAGVTLDITERKEAEDLLRRRAEELRLRNEELTRFNRATVDRELRMIELKKLTNDLCRQLGQPPRYPLTFDAESNEPPHA
jgi:PAS domain S-box-containing protein